MLPDETLKRAVALLDYYRSIHPCPEHARAQQTADVLMALLGDYHDTQAELTLLHDLIGGNDRRQTPEG